MSTQAVDAFKTKIHNATIKNHPAPNKAGIVDGTSTQSVGVKVHLDTTPGFKGVWYPGQDGTVRSLKKADGSPAIDWRWTVNGKMAWNSAEIADPFELGSYDDADNGCTPTFVQRTQVGPGRNEVRAWPLIHAEDNGGVEVQGEPVVWTCD